MDYIDAVAKDFDGPKRKYEVVGLGPYCVPAREAQDIRMGKRVSVTAVYKPITELKTFSDDEPVKLLVITDPRIREGLLKRLKFSN